MGLPARGRKGGKKKGSTRGTGIRAARRWIQGFSLSYVTLESCYHRTCQGNERGEFVRGVESPSTYTCSLKQLLYHAFTPLIAHFYLSNAKIAKGKQALISLLIERGSMFSYQSCVINRPVRARGV